MGRLADALVVRLPEGLGGGVIDALQPGHIAQDLDAVGDAVAVENDRAQVARFQGCQVGDHGFADVQVLQGLVGQRPDVSQRHVATAAGQDNSLERQPSEM